MPTVTKNYIISASPKEVYNALIDEDIIEQWSGSAATMDIEHNGLFSLWEGSIHGVNLEVNPTKIVQHWKQIEWSDYSKCTFTITAKGKDTELNLVHQDIPEQSAKDIDNGWDEYYLQPLKQLLEG